MKNFTDNEIFNGFLNNNRDIIKFLINAIYPEIEKNLSLWFEGEYLLERISKEFIKMRFIVLKGIMRRDIKNKNEISVSEVLDFCKKDFYDNLFHIKIVFEHFNVEGQHFVRSRFKKRNVVNISDKEFDIQDICMEALEAFSSNYIRLFPNDQHKCNLGVYYGILKNKTSDYFNNNEISKSDIYSGNADSGDEIKKFRNRVPIDNIINIQGQGLDEVYEPQINKIEALSFLSEILSEILKEKELEEIIKIAEDYIICFKQNDISEICIKIVLLIFYGFDHDEIREIVLKENGGKFTKDGFKVRVNRCRDDIKKKCRKI